MSGLIFKYWGKARPSSEDGTQLHLLPYHCLDAAAVAQVWLDECVSLREKFAAVFPGAYSQEQVQAWIVFFVALHDLGKFDIRFQLKAPDALAAAWRRLVKEDHEISEREIREFDHGLAGHAWAQREHDGWASSTLRNWDSWIPWLAAVTGHHGDYTVSVMHNLNLDTDEVLIEHDREARAEFVRELESLFLILAGLSIKDGPPPCSLAARTLVAGFCAVCDWIGSNTDFFDYCASSSRELSEYFHTCAKKIRTDDLLRRFGLTGNIRGYEGVFALLGERESPRGIQTEIDGLPAISGLTLVEAPTGSGKTEAALAYAWRLLDAGMADSIVFALPTQATANAMLQRLDSFAARVFGSANVVLAHGKSQLNENFRKMVEGGRHATAQGKMEAAVQCAAWLASSRKRVFLGQIGVCTIDQVLLSVLPVRHKFVRGFGVAKSVLIVDEVHAYDAYMHGLLGEVLRAQKSAGGSAILLSATLPAGLRAKLLQTWGASGPEAAPYPALWHTSGGAAVPRTVREDQRPAPRTVAVECLKVADAFPDNELIERLLMAAEGGAQVAVVLNLVDDAQRLARLLRAKSTVEVALFHARFRFTDRQEKEKTCLEHFGRNAPRTPGRILVATQVVEQSLDLDFDWMVTQICPVDLLFQRLGRLHRHERDRRPAGFERPCCTVLSVAGDDFGAHKLIYGNARVLWRTECLLLTNTSIEFPEAYRDWIEEVYQADDWKDEPENIACDYTTYSALQRAREKDAQRLTTMTVGSFRDEDDRITGLTRDGEMSLSVLPLLSDGRLLDGRGLNKLPEWDQAEALNLNSVPVPASWKNHLRDCICDNEGLLAGYLQLVLNAVGHGSWSTENGKFNYSQDFGLEKARNESA